MEALTSDSPLRQLYPEDTYPNGAYYQSPFGRTKYWIIGPGTGKRVVLIHGISVPSIVWKDISGALISSGFEVLLYDTYGRGYSEAPNAPSEPNLYVLQLALLLQYIHWDKTDIVGFASGGAIAAAFASTCPHLVNKTVFVAASGMMPMTTSEANRATTVEPPAMVVELRNLQEACLLEFSHVLSSTRKDGLFTGLHWAYKTLGELSSIRCLIIHGTNDQVIPFAHAEKIKEYIHMATLVPIEGGSHFLPIEDGLREIVAETIVNFLV